MFNVRMKSILLFLTFVQVAFSASKKELIEKFIDKQNIPKNELGLIITNHHNEVIYEYNPDKKLIPASITKIITSGAILKSMPPGYKFKTQLLLSEKYQIKDETYKGDLFLKGGGDPSFVSENMWFLVNIFDRLGIKKIEGDIIVDDSLFDKVRFDESRQEVRVDRAYDAPVGAMSFNWNSVNIFIRPNGNGKKPKIFIDPDVPMFTIENKATLVEGDNNNLSVEKRNNKIIVSGKLGKNSKEVVFFKNIQEPDEWAGENLKLFLKHRGISVSGGIKNRKTPTTAEVVAEYESKPIEVIMADMNKFSNNYVAEMLIKNLSLSLAPIGNMADGMKMVNQYIESLKLNKDSYEVYNPSGLTRDNKITARSMVRILENLHSDFKVFPEFVNSLPIAGVDGTLKKRMKGEAGERWVRAKTGYLTNVVSLAGYAGLTDGQVYQFSFIFNGKTDETKIKNTFDKILNILVE